MYDLHRVYDTKYKMFMVLELVTGGELLERLMNEGNYNEKECCDLFSKVPIPASPCLPGWSYMRRKRYHCVLWRPTAQFDTEISI